jgi:hypothetical protein
MLIFHRIPTSDCLAPPSAHSIVAMPTSEAVEDDPHIDAIVRARVHILLNLSDEQI